MSLSAWLNRLGPFLGLAVVFVLFAILTPDSFLSSRNLETSLRQSVVVGTAALGMTVVIVAGGIDLSVGSVVALVTVVIAYLLKRHDWPPALAATAGLATGALCGTVNGLLVTRLRVVPFIVTLGTLLIVRGIAKDLADDAKITPRATGLNDLLTRPEGSLGWMGVAPGVWIMLLLAAAVAALLRYTVLGRHVFAVGSNEPAARLCGVPVDRVKITVYALGGLFAGVSGLMLFSYLGGGDSTEAGGLELDVIAAVVIGGGSLAGGEGSVLGTLVGALIMQVLDSGSSLMGWPNRVQEIVTGAIIVAAVALDRWRQRG
jgi:ribose/xylose/arabinose/galactoside ABC-type transport system permease subunit